MHIFILPHIDFRGQLIFMTAGISVSLFPCLRAKDFLIKTSSAIDFLIKKLLVRHFRKKSCNTNIAFLTIFFQGKVSLREESFLNFSQNRQEFKKQHLTCGLRPLNLHFFCSCAFCPSVQRIDFTSILILKLSFFMTCSIV